MDFAKIRFSGGPSRWTLPKFLIVRQNVVFGRFWPFLRFFVGDADGFSDVFRTFSRARGGTSDDVVLAFFRLFRLFSTFSHENDVFRPFFDHFHRFIKKGQN